MADTSGDGVPPITRAEHSSDAKSKKTTLRQFIPATGEWVNVSAVDNGDGTYSLKTSTTVGSVNTEPTFKEDPSNSAEDPKYGKVDANGVVQVNDPNKQTDALTNTELRASAISVSQSSQPLPTGAATEATLSSLESRATPFSEVQTSERTSLINLSSVYPISALRNITSGTVNFSGAEYEVTDGAKLESAEIGRYVPGYAAEVGIGVRLATLPTTATWGYYDSNNGMQWKVTSGDLQAVLRRDGTDEEVIDRADFNVDPLDGTGPSGITWSANSNFIYQIRFTWYGYGQIEWQIVSSSGSEMQKIYPVHRLKVEGSTSIFSPNLPITAESTGGSIFVAGRQMSILGKYRPQQRITSVVDTGTSVSTSLVPLCSFRRKDNADSKSISIILQGLSVITNMDIELSVLVGATLTNASWGTPSNRSASETAIEVDTSATSFTGGESIWHEMIHADGTGANLSGSAESTLDIRIPRLQPVTLVARRFTGLSDGTVRAVLRCAEAW